MFDTLKKSPASLQLNRELLIGRGGVRYVYRHPLDDDKCIKLLFNADKRRAVVREEAYLRKYWKAGKPFTHLSRFFGHCRTTLGRGSVFQLVRDFDGNISNPLPLFLPGDLLADRLAPAQIAQLLQQLHDHLLTNEIIVSDPAPANIVVKFLASDLPTLVLIDGIGNPHFIKIADYRSRDARKIIDKKWQYYLVNNPLLSGIL